MKEEGPIIIHIESSHPVCSVLLSSGGEQVFYRQSSDETSHQQSLPILIREATSSLGEQGFGKLQAIHLCAGPGSYTGLRIGFSIAMGLAVGLDIPVILSSSNEILAEYGRNHLSPSSDRKVIYTAIKARPNEIYGQLFDFSSGNSLNELIVERIEHGVLGSFEEDLPIAVLGSGAYLDGLEDSRFFLKRNIQLDALMMLSLGERKFLSGSFTALTELNPLYLKPPRVIKSKKKLFK